jgi:molecular chaperone DnaJ
MQVRLSGEGDVGNDGGRAGNLYVHVDVQDHEFFQRDGNDLLYRLPINVSEAALGVEKTIPTLDRDGDGQALRIPHGTQPGAEFRLRGKGVPHISSARRGDLKVLVDIQVPRTLTARQRKLLEALARSMDPDAAPDEPTDVDLGEDEDQDKGLINRIKEALG